MGKRREVVQLNALNLLNMEREVQVSETIAFSLGLLGGMLIFCSNLIVSIAAQIAKENQQNMAVVSAIANGTIPLGLLGSYFIYKEQLTFLHLIGSIACLAGILTISLSVLVTSETDSVAVQTQD